MLVDTLQVAGVRGRFVVLDLNPDLWGKDIYGVPIEGGDERLPDLVGCGANCFTVGLGATGDNRPRHRLFELGIASKLEPLQVVDPRAHCSPHARIGLGSHLLAGSIVSANAEVGANVIINSGAIVEHDCYVGNHVHVASGARLTSSIRVGEGAHIGAGATVRQGVRIGKWAVIGAGAVVVEDVSDGTTVVGVPARPIGQRKRQTV